MTTMTELSKYDHPKALSDIGGCITATARNGVVCANFPVIGQKCVNTHLSWLNGTVEACVKVHWTYTELIIKVNGRVVFTKRFHIFNEYGQVYAELNLGTCITLTAKKGVLTANFPIIGKKSINTGLKWLNGQVQACVSYGGCGLFSATLKIKVDGKVVYTKCFKLGFVSTKTDEAMLYYICNHEELPNGHQSISIRHNNQWQIKCDSANWDGIFFFPYMMFRI